MRFVLDLLYLLAAAVYSPKVIYKTLKHKRYRTGWDQRFGKIIRKNPQKKCIWLHAVSVGEVNAAKTIVKELQNRFADFEIVISTTTDTGFARASSLFGENLQVFYFPFDLSWVMRRVFSNIRPTICLLMELEIWPNFIHTAQQLNIPVIVVNGRMSDKSFPRYKIIKPIIKKIFGKISLVLAQTEQYAQRFKELGCSNNNVIVTGSLKYDTAQITDKVEGADTLEAQLNIGNGKLWVAGATGNDEEKILLDVYKQLKQHKQFSDLRLAIVPRKPERFDEVAQLIENEGIPLIRYSHLKNNAAPPPTDNQVIILGDTMGDLRKFYSLATIIFVGRSLVPMGGSDMAEAAALGKCTIFGPYAFNFKQTVDALLADHGAILVKDEKKLLQTMQKCLSDSDFIQSIAENGREVIRKNQGATAKSIEQIAKFLNPPQ
ncbi:MAG: 3-deoxy-D-manno-octulosonic acid transferase [Phycisphaerales bacterium]|jgi:3-deoxy-D-manno-octulosonic-acid transferase